jgi:hypothetical protein
MEHNPAASSDPAETLKIWQRVREIYRVVWSQDPPKHANGNGQTMTGQM